MPAAATETQQPAAAPLALRVAFLGARGRALLGAWVEAVDSAALADERDGERLDALVCDADGGGLERAALQRTLEAARARGARVIGIAAERGGEPRYGGAADVVFSRRPLEGALCAPAPIDPRVTNPLGFRHSEVAGLALVAGPGADPGPALERFGAAAAAEPLLLYCPPGGGEPPPGVARQSLPDSAGELEAALKQRLGVLDHPALHADAPARAQALVRLCAAGVPVACPERSAELEALLGERLSAALAEPHWRTLCDLDARERASVAQRRAALLEHSLEARWRALAGAAGIAVPDPPTVSVIFSTRRQQWLSFGLAQVARQNYQPRELVVCLHGEEFSPDVEERLRAEVEGPLRIVHVAGELTLGDALNAGVEVASGAYVTKMDDDDYYSTDHLADLVLALQYSGADLCGKAAEFVYLEDIALTIRRFMGDTERASERPLAGGGMMARREPLRELGGWSSRSRGEDTALIKSFRDAGRPLHRTHGYGYILNRHGRDHTWNTYVDYFLVQSQREWRGLRFDEAGIY